MGFKAKSFLGIFSIRNGCFVACFLQIFIGFGLWGSLQYLRPMYKIFNNLVLAYFILGAVLGFYGIYARSEIIVWIYLLHLGSCATIVGLLVVDFAGIIRILPTPPAHPTVPVVPPIVEKIQNVEAAIEKKVSGSLSGPPHITQNSEKQQETTSTENHIARAPVAGASFKSDQRGKPYLHQFGMHSGVSPIRGLHRSIDGRHHRLELDAIQSSTKEESNVNMALAAVPPTEGQSEEVSKDELPPEYANMSKGQKNEVSAITKIVKHIFKLCVAGLLASALCFQIYCSYVVMTFALNKCMSLDELTGQPEQFEPILRAETMETDFSRVSTAA